MADERESKPYFGSDESRFATGADEDRLRGESSPPALTDEPGTPHFAKGHAPAEHRASTRTLTEEERAERANSAPPEPRSRGVPSPQEQR
jgi:hypothetical protein